MRENPQNLWYAFFYFTKILPAYAVANERSYMEIVSIKNNEAFTDSRIIAIGTNNKHHSVTAVIQKYSTDFEDFGKVRFEMEPLASGQKEKVYILNQQQATLLMTYLRNSEITRKFKKELVRQFYLMQQFIFERQSKYWIETREQGKLTRKAEMPCRLPVDLHTFKGIFYTKGRYFL